MSIIVSNCQHCNEQQFRTLSCVHYRLVKSNLFIRALLLDRILVTEKNYAYASRTSCYKNNCPICITFHFNNLKE